jgi:hypothetical protein
MPQPSPFYDYLVLILTPDFSKAGDNIIPHLRLGFLSDQLFLACSGLYYVISYVGSMSHLILLAFILLVRVSVSA